MGKFHADLEAHLNFSKFCEPAKCSVIFIQSLAYLTPIVFLILPRIQGTTTPPIKENEKTNQCDIGCEGKIFWSDALHFTVFKDTLASKFLFQEYLEP